MGDPLETNQVREKGAQCQKNRRGDPLHSSGFVGYVKKLENQKGSFGDKKIRKKLHSVEKIEKGDPLVPFGFVGYVKKVKNQRGPFGIT